MAEPSGCVKHAPRGLAPQCSASARARRRSAAGHWLVVAIGMGLAVGAHRLSSSGSVFAHRGRSSNGMTSVNAPVLRHSPRCAQQPRFLERRSSAVALRAATVGRRTPLVRASSKPQLAEAPPQFSSVSQSSVNLVKNIVGSGMLSLPSGVAAFNGSPKALVPSLVFTVVLSIVSAYTFVLIADACERTGETSYQGAWSKTVGPRTRFLPALACLAKSAISCIAFSMIFGDCLAILVSPFGLPKLIASRSSTMVAVSAFVLFPLCSMRSLAPLAKFSVLGVLSNVYISAFVLLRACDGSYRQGGALARAAPALPRFAAEAGGAWRTASHPGVAVLLSILATAFLAHYNAPLFYEQLAPGPDGRKGGRRFLAVSLLGFTASAAIFCSVMAGGFLTFGSASAGLILNNYAATDSLATLARLAILLSLITGYPITFFSARSQVLGLLGGNAKYAERRPGMTTAALLSLFTLAALNLRNLGRLAAFAGACFGSFLIYIAPPLMVLMAQRRGIGPPAGGVAERVINMGLIPLGVCLGVLGALQSLR